MKRYLARWCVGWVDLCASLVEILSFGFKLTSWRLRAAEFFAFRHWFE